MRQGFDGVRPASESSIEIGFFYEGRHCVERIRAKPTAANLKRAADRRAAILEAIARGEFDYGAEFPKRGGATKPSQGSA
ncbi:Arm DNA-binding domain-containing protein [Achromobacter aegrifaciens]